MRAVVVDNISFNVCLLVVFFFFKQKTAYEMRISDWSSDVCSSDLPHVLAAFPTLHRHVGDKTRPFFLKLSHVHLTRRSEEHTSELQSLKRNSYAVFCLKKQTNNQILSRVITTP